MPLDRPVASGFLIFGSVCIKRSAFWLFLKGNLKSHREAKKGKKCTQLRCNFGGAIIAVKLGSEEHSMDQYRSRLKLSENFERHWSIRISGEIHMDQSLVHTLSWGNLYGPMVLKVLLKFPPTLVLVHGWLFPAGGRCQKRQEGWLPLGPMPKA